MLMDPSGLYSGSPVVRSVALELEGDCCSVSLLWGLGLDVDAARAASAMATASMAAAFCPPRTLTLAVPLASLILGYDGGEDEEEEDVVVAASLARLRLVPCVCTAVEEEGGDEEVASPLENVLEGMPPELFMCMYAVENCCCMS